MILISPVGTLPVSGFQDILSQHAMFWLLYFGCCWKSPFLSGWPLVNYRVFRAEIQGLSHTGHLVKSGGAWGTPDLDQDLDGPGKALDRVTF